MTDIMIQTKTIENIINNVVISIVSFICNFILDFHRFDLID
jgi:putative flippase GtrA